MPGAVSVNCVAFVVPGNPVRVPHFRTLQPFSSATHVWPAATSPQVGSLLTALAGCLDGSSLRDAQQLQKSPSSVPVDDQGATILLGRSTPPTANILKSGHWFEALQMLGSQNDAS